jgi:hypothetical protein
MSDAAQLESPEGRLYAAGFTRRLEWWVPPGEDRAIGQGDAIALLDSGNFTAPGISFPDGGVRPFPDELVDRACPPPITEPPPPPGWLVAQAEVIAQVTVEMMKPLIRAEIRAALRAKGGKS